MQSRRAQFPCMYACTYRQTRRDAETQKCRRHARGQNCGGWIDRHYVCLQKGRPSTSRDRPPRCLCVTSIEVEVSAFSFCPFLLFECCSMLNAWPNRSPLFYSQVVTSAECVARSTATWRTHSAPERPTSPRPLPSLGIGMVGGPACASSGSSDPSPQERGMYCTTAFPVAVGQLWGRTDTANPFANRRDTHA